MVIPRSAQVTGGSLKIGKQPVLVTLHKRAVTRVLSNLFTECAPCAREHKLMLTWSVNILHEILSCLLIEPCSVSQRIQCLIDLGQSFNSSLTFHCRDCKPFQPFCFLRCAIKVQICPATMMPKGPVGPAERVTRRSPTNGAEPTEVATTSGDNPTKKMPLHRHHQISRHTSRLHHTTSLRPAHS